MSSCTSRRSKPRGIVLWTRAQKWSLKSRRAPRVCKRPTSRRPSVLRRPSCPRLDSGRSPDPVQSWRSMSKEDSIEVTGTVLEKFPSGLFSVQLEHDRVVLAHLAGRLRRNRIRVLAGDRVTLELSPYDLTKGRITFRHR